VVVGLDWFYSQLLSDWNNWNFETLGTCVSLKRFERSKAIEREIPRMVSWSNHWNWPQHALAIERLERLAFACFLVPHACY
jgi:hypothetical protein